MAITPICPRKDRVRMASEFRSRAFSNSEAAHRGLGSEKRLRSPARIATRETATQLPLPSAAALAQLGAVARLSLRDKESLACGGNWSCLHGDSGGSESVRRPERGAPLVSADRERLPGHQRHGAHVPDRAQQPAVVEPALGVRDIFDHFYAAPPRLGKSKPATRS